MCARFLALFLFALLLGLGRVAAAAPPPGVHGPHEIEAGGLVGGHFFSGSNELGRFDLDPRSPANAPQHSFFLGLAASYAPHPRVAIEAELGLLPTTTRDGSATVVMLTYRAHALVHLLTGRLRPFLLLGGGATSLVSTTDRSVIGTDTDPSLYGGVGLKLDLPRSLVLRLDGRILFPPRIEDSLVTPEFELLVGLGGRFALRRPRPAAQAEAAKAEPATAAPGPARSEVKRPEVKRPQDSRPEPTRAEPAQGGGPGAGAGKPAGKDRADGDQDGVPDADDRCPGKPETRNGFDDGDGCPDKLPKPLARLGAFAAGMGFQPGKPLFTHPTLAALKKLARLLQTYPTVRIEITVAPADGAEPAELAARRAALLRQYLTEIGVDGARLTSAAGPPAGKKARVALRLIP